MRRSASQLVFAMTLALTLAACSSAPSKPQAQPIAKAEKAAKPAKAAKPVPPLRVDMQQDEGGFTIVEEVRVGNDIHADYDAAMRSFEQKQYEQGIASLVRVTQAAPNVTAAHIDLGIAYASSDARDSSLQREPATRKRSRCRRRSTTRAAISRFSAICTWPTARAR
jgi:uncharacterized lipoprotein YmbA